MSKRKRNLGMRCVLFPDDVKDAFRKSRKEPNKTSTPATKSWERCGDSFVDTSVIQNLQTSEKTSRGVRKVVQTQVTGDCSDLNDLQRVREASTDEPVHIAWSSSEDEESDTEDPPPQTSRAHKQHPVDYCRSLRMLSAGVDTDDLPSIDSDSETEEDNSTSKDQTDFPNPVANTEGDILKNVGSRTTPDPIHFYCMDTKPMQSPADISVYSSNGDEDPEENRADSSLLDPADTSRQSVSEWVRSAQAILQTPQKQTTRTIKTPEDSSKKNRKFERGGLAEKLNRLHSRQRSAISFWRHQCNSSTSAADRPGVLTLRILGVREECGMQAAVCDRLPENEKCVALFSKDTAAQLQPTPGDIVHIYPPWQNLVVEGELYPIILNTHFSQKVCVETDSTACPRSGVSVEKCRPPQLTRCLWRSETSRGSSEKSVPCEQVSESSCSDRRCVRDSLLDAVEDCGSSGCQGGPVEVVVQRVYCIPISRSERVSLQHRTPGRPPSRPELSDHVGRLCAVVQDGYGMFADVLLRRVSTDAEIQQSSEQLEGRVCVLQGLRVIQRLTRDRCSSLFSLIDSLWPPLAAPKSLEDLLQSPSGKVPTPSFCYRLSVQQGHMVPLSGQDVSPLYRPPVLQTLREITQDASLKHRCSFRATLVHKHLLGSNAGEMLLFVTDLSLQTELNAESVRKSASVCVSPSCLIPSWVSQALDDPQGRPVLRFRDAVMEQGQIFCVEQTVMELDPDEPTFSVTRPVTLDQLTPEAPPHSLCSLSGVIVEVDESTAFSWPACSRCGSCRLERAQGEGFQCLMCGAMMDEPNTKMRLDVFVCCPSMRHCTVKVKLQQKTITSLLNSTQSPEEYTVEHVLGTEIGPLSALVQVVNRSHAAWMLLEEFDLH